MHHRLFFWACGFSIIVALVIHRPEPMRVLHDMAQLPPQAYRALPVFKLPSGLRNLLYEE